ncbi:hypothetical protein Acy02nite_57800 [Actinoplanes cyaneus]|uniref:Uncharacterized protein n=1 Tax=Actinoplanes cyaneus TaxID=52696 RepID=A0A919ILH2_9ACTN|nr:response regulator transcription factor [Actinoplanes cyaneus]GID67899.1 hypothetical protein Acy02nite_57800 [Actinoplanes cyaneus]
MSRRALPVRPTVKTHVCRIIMRLEVHDRTQAVVVAHQNKLVTPGSEPPKRGSDGFR